jgi:hypothetical protein
MPLYSVGNGVVSGRLRFGCAARGRGSQASARSEKRARGGRPAACGGGYSNNIHPSRSWYATVPQSRISANRFAVPVGRGVSLRAAIGEHGLRRRPWRRAVICRSAGQRPAGRARVAGTQRADGAAAAINPGWSRPLNAVGGWKLGLLITDLLASSTPRSRCCAVARGSHPRGSPGRVWGHLRGDRATTRRRARRPRAAPPAARGPRIARPLLGRSPCGG